MYVDVQRVPTRCWNVGNVLFVFSEGALACNSIWTNAATSLYAGYFPDGSLPAGGRLKNVRWRRGEEKQWGRLCSTGETRREKLDVPLEAEASIFFQVSSSMRDLGDRLFFLCPFVSRMEIEEGEKKIIIMVERCRSLNVSREKTIRYNVFSKCLYDRMKNNRGFKRRSIFFRSLFKFPPMREFVENKN